MNRQKLVIVLVLIVTAGLCPPAVAADVPFSPPQVISLSADGAYSVFAADIDGDGDTDVLSSSTLDDKIALYKNNGSSPPVFTEHLISDAADGAHSVFAADIDGDGDTDVLSASGYDDKIAWYENLTPAVPALTGRVLAAMTLLLAATGAVLIRRRAGGRACGAMR